MTVKIRDGRTGRDPALVGQDGRGELLHSFDAASMDQLVAVEIGTTVVLPDDTVWPVIGVEDEIDNAAQAWVRHATIGTA